MRLIVANLDAEAALAGVTPGLSEAVWKRIARAGTLVAALGRAGDRLWLPRQVPLRDDVPLPAVDVVSGSLADAGRGAARILAWCETPAVAALRSESGSGSGSGSESEPGSEPRTWVSALWGITPPDPAVVARVNDRAFGYRIAERAFCALPGTQRVTDIADIERWLGRGGADLGAGGWVAKAPLSAAGRDRARGLGLPIPADVKIRLERLLARFGELWLEPWCERMADFGVAGFVDGDRVTVFPPHRLVVDGRGAARAIVVDGQKSSPWVCPADQGAIADTARQAATALANAGYRGAFGIDGFAYRNRTGNARLCPLIELNARLAFGHIARAIHPEGGTLQIA